MRRAHCILAVLTTVAGALYALQNTNVTGQAVGTDPQHPNQPDRYEITVTLHPGDPAIHDFHLYWANTDGVPSQPNWSGPSTTWNANVYDNVVPPPGTPQVTGNVDAVSFSSTAGMQAGTGPTTFTFTFKPYGGPGQPPPRTVYYYLTTDGSYGLPAGVGDDDVEEWGMLNQAGSWNFPTW